MRPSIAVATAFRLDEGSVIDVVSALDLVAEIVSRTASARVDAPRSAQTTCCGICMRGSYGALGCIVGQALQSAGGPRHDLERARHATVREALVAELLPLTLGAVAVVDRAQRSHDQGRNQTDVLMDAADAAAAYLGLTPDSLFNIGNPHA